MALTSKETEFCRQFAFCRDPRESAARAGFENPEKSGLKLLSKPQIAAETERITERLKCYSQAVEGLRKIAFGSVADAVRLVLNPEDVTDIDGLDLFMISEIKMQKSGGMELKFYDRIKALQTLCELEEIAETEGAAPFINAIFKGAEAVTALSGSEEE